ncbi:MAG: hypothetical protein MJZ46_00550 [Bacteroidales bacterium]|nr:hypothetical protein [Bacteroidales bacterium]
MRKTAFILLFLLCLGHFCHAQWSDAYTTTQAQLENIQQRLSTLDSEDPELITLHYYFLQDCIKELQDLKENGDERLFYCKDKQKLERQGEKLLSQADSLLAIFTEQIQIVDELFYSKARIDYIFADNEKADYYLSRALQYNKHNVDALLLKAQIKFEAEEYAECIPLIKALFNNNELSEEQENEIYRFSSEYYYKVYQTGDSLVKIDKGAYAIDLFQLLEDFCHDIPSSYCNDDYYHGIMRSKTGIYDSYIAIAKAAHQRKNYELEKKYLQYAEEYLKENGLEVE